MKKLLIFILLLTGTVLYGQQLINLGTGPNTGTGESLRSSLDKTNKNFIAVYDTFKLKASLIRPIFTGPVTITSGNFILGSGNLTMTGSLASTGSRVLKGWFTNLEVTNLPTINGGTLKTALSLTASDVGLGNVTNESKATMFTSPAFTGNVPTTGGVPLGRAISVTSNLSAGVLTDINLGVSTEPYNIQLFSSGGSNLTGSVVDSVALDGGTYHLYIYSVDAMSNVKIKFLY